jgi:predicted amidohydrolase YtcJ
VGRRSALADGLRMIREQAQRTPPGQWVRGVGGWTEFQFVERRMPTLDELNRAAPDAPVFVLHLYDRALLNRAVLRAVGYPKDSPNPPGGEIVRDTPGNPTGILIARPNALILYATLAKGPKLPPEYKVNSSRHFMRELNRLGITSAIDAGGGFQNYPEDYEVIEGLHKHGELTVRIVYNLFTQKPKGASWCGSCGISGSSKVYRDLWGHLPRPPSPWATERKIAIPDINYSVEADRERYGSGLVAGRRQQPSWATPRGRSYRNAYRRGGGSRDGL